MGVEVCSSSEWSACVEAPFGVVRLAASDSALNRVILGADVCDCAKQGAPEWFIELLEQMKRYFDAERVDFSWVPVNFGVEIGVFRKRVLMAARGIQYGCTMSYGELALAVGRGSAARAVGGAMAANPVPVIIPCHRVLPKSGGVGGFSAGEKIKRSLLELEGIKV